MCTKRIICVNKSEDILSALRETPIAELLLSHNLGVQVRKYDRPKILICTCMDYRVKLKIPEKYAFIIRTPGANLVDSHFGLATAVAMRSIRAVAIMAHTDCAMTHIADKSEIFIEGLTQAGWGQEEAKTYFERQAPEHSIGDAIQIVIDQCQRLRKHYPNILFAPLLYKVEDGKLYQVTE